MSLYAMLFFGLLIFGFNTYVFLLNDKTKNYLPQKKESNI